MLYNNGSTAFNRVSQQGINTAPSQGANTTVKREGGEKSRLPMQLATGEAMFNAMGKGESIPGLAVGLFTNPGMGSAASLGYGEGKNASNPWEAFVAGGIEANKSGMFSFGPQALIPQDPVTNFLAGGHAALGGFLF